MKKIIPAFIAIFGLGACAFSSLVSFNHKNSNSFIKASAISNEVSVEIANNGDWNPFGWGTHGLSNDGLTDSVTANNEANLWGSSFLDLNKHESIELELSLNAYDGIEDPDPIGNNTDGLDIYLKSTDNNTVFAIFRVWTKAWGAHNGTHSIQLWEGNWGASASMDSLFPSEGGGSTAVIKGDATSDSSFKFRFSKTYGIEFYNTWSSWSHCSSPAVTDPIVSRLTNNPVFSLVIGADGGFSKDITVTLKSYNGQSFANDGVNFTDNVGPEIVNANGGNVNKYQPVPHEASAWDVFGGDREVSYLNTSAQLFPEYFDETGETVVKAVASDGNGNNSHTSMNFTVGNPTASSFAAWLLMEHTEECASKYQKAKNIFKELSSEERTAFQEGDYADARARYEEWCRINNDDSPYDGGDPVSSNGFFGINTNANKNMTAVVVVSISIFVVISALIGFYAIKRRKHQ